MTRQSESRPGKERWRDLLISRLVPDTRERGLCRVGPGPQTGALGRAEGEAGARGGWRLPLDR